MRFRNSAGLTPAKRDRNKYGNTVSAFDWIAAVSRADVCAGLRMTALLPQFSFFFFRRLVGGMGSSPSHPSSVAQRNQAPRLRRWFFRWMSPPGRLLRCSLTCSFAMSLAVVPGGSDLMNHRQRDRRSERYAGRSSSLIPYWMNASRHSSGEPMISTYLSRSMVCCAHCLRLVP